MAFGCSYFRYNARSAAGAHCNARCVRFLVAIVGHPLVDDEFNVPFRIVLIQEVVVKEHGFHGLLARVCVGRGKATRGRLFSTEILKDCDWETRVDCTTAESDEATAHREIERMRCICSFATSF